MIVGIHQPNFIPWIGYFYKIYRSDIFVLLNDVQFVKNSYADRNSIKTSNGCCYLKLPLEIPSHTTNYNEIRIKHELNWKDKQLKTIEMNYKKAPFFKEVFSDVEMWFSSEEKMLDKFNSKIIMDISKKLNFSTEFVYSGDFHILDKSTDRLIDIIKLCGGDAYFSGMGGTKYQEEERYKEEKIKLIYTDFTYPEYPQLWKGFEKNLTVLDILFNCGYEKSAEIIKGAGK